MLILDNPRIHHTKLIQPFFKDHRDTLTRMFLPPYSPPLNPIEGLWGWLKSSVICHVCFHTVEAIPLIRSRPMPLGSGGIALYA